VGGEGWVVQPATRWKGRGKGMGGGGGVAVAVKGEVVREDGADSERGEAKLVFVEAQLQGLLEEEAIVQGRRRSVGAREDAAGGRHASGDGASPMWVAPVLEGRSPSGTDEEEDECGVRAPSPGQDLSLILARYEEVLRQRTRNHLGYPYNLDFDFRELDRFNGYTINNLGDPFVESNYGVHSRAFEVGVLDWFARLWEIERKHYWGYITNCGTEGNLHGILVGREVLPDGVLYSSRETHYSVFKAARMYRMPLRKVATTSNGELDYADFERHLCENLSLPAIVNVNIGTTVRGAVDDVDKVIEVLVRCGYTEDRFYIHCDGALFGLMMPFVKEAPHVSFRKPIGSVSVSGHKFVGCPMPCGVVITRRKHIDRMSEDIEYLNSKDATIMGSRNGHAPLFLWYTLNKKGLAGFAADVKRCLEIAQWLKECMISRGVERVMLNELSSTVVFERPMDMAFVRKWQLACEDNVAHVVVMPSVRKDVLEEFVDGLVEVLEGARAAKAGAPAVAL